MKYIYGAAFAVLVGLAVLLILSTLVPGMVALATAGFVILLLVVPSVKFMNRDSMRDNLLGED